MPDGVDPRDNINPAAREAELQDEFLQEKLLSEEGVNPRMCLTRVQIRLGRRFFSLWWLLGIAAGLGAVLVAAAKIYADSSAGRGFLARHACIPTSGSVPAGMPAFVRWAHLLTFFFLVIIVRSGLQVLADHPRLYTKVHCTPGREWLRFRGPVPTDCVWTAKEDTITLSPLVGLPGGRHTIGVARHWHFSFDILFVATGIVYAAFLFSTPSLHRLVPTRASIVPSAASCAVTYLSLHFPSGPSGFFRYDALQQLTYFSVIFILAPLAILTGLAMSPALDNRYRWYPRLFGNRQIARSLHFLVMISFVVFFIGHMALVALTGFAPNLNDITLGNNHDNLDGFAIWTGVIALVIAFNVWAVRFSWTHTRVLQRISNLTVGRLMDLLFDHSAPRVEYRPEEISPYFWPNHARMPDSPEWQALAGDDFRAYRLKVHGLVDNPVELSLEQIEALRKQEQITLHHCIQGWSGIAEWGGLPFAELIELVQPKPEAKWVMFLLRRRRGRRGPLLRLPLDRRPASLAKPARLRDERGTATDPARPAATAARREPTRLQTRQMDQRDRVRPPFPRALRRTRWLQRRPRVLRLPRRNLGDRMTSTETEAHTVTIDYRQTLDQMIAAGGYDHVNRHITSRAFRWRAATPPSGS